MLLKKRMPYFLLLFCTVINLKGQNMLPLTEITLKDGLSQGMIFDILQTSDGFMWFATKDGLNRYDGKNFVVYRNSPIDSFSISNDMVLKLFEDKHHNFWIKTKTSLDIFDPKTGHFRHILSVSNTSAKFNNSLTADIEEDNQGTIYITSPEEGIHTLQVKEQLVDFFPKIANIGNKLPLKLIPLPDKEAYIYDIFISRKNEVYIATSDDVYQVLAQEKKIIPLHAPSVINADEPRTKLLLENTNGNLVLAKSGYQLLWDKKTFTPILNCDILESSCMYYQNKELWIANIEGDVPSIERLPSTDFTAENYQKRITYQFSSLALPTKLYCDNMGGVWIGTNGYGIRKYNPIREGFRHFAAKNSISQLQKDGQNIVYAQIFRSFFQLLPPYYEWQYSHSIKPIKIGKNPDEVWANWRQKNPSIKLSKYVDYGMLLDFQHSNWLLTNTDGDPLDTNHVLVKMDVNWQTLKSYPVHARFDNLAMLCSDKKGHIWFNSSEGKVFCFDPISETFQTYHYAFLFKKNIPKVAFIHFDVANTLWLGTTDGLIKGTEQNGKYTFELYQNDINNHQSLSNNVVASICDDPKTAYKYLWIGTKGGGLIRMNKQNATFKAFTETNGLPNNTVYGILPDEEGNLWLSTNRGIVKFNPITEFCRVYTKEDGLQDDEFNTQSFFKSPQGELCFGGINGLNVFKPSEIMVSKTPPKIVLVGLKINNKDIQLGDSTSILPYSLQTLQTLNLNYLQNNITFSFAALDFTYSNKNQYQYKYMLEGADREWVYAGSQDMANYTALSPGNYTFKVMARNADGLWSATPAMMMLTIKPPFWRTYWAYFIYCVLLIFIAYRLYQAQINRAKLANQLAFEQKEAERLAALDELKMRFFSNVTHEFRTPLTLIIEPARQLVKKLLGKPLQQDALIIENNSQKLLQLVNQLLDLAKLESGSMKMESHIGEIIGLVQPIYDAFLHLAKNKDIHFTWSHPPQIPPFAFDRDKIEKILHNLLSNAFKFTPQNGTVHLTTSLHQQALLIVVQDSGIGMKSESLSQLFTRFYQADNSSTRKGEGTGIGLSLVKEFTALMQGTIQVESEWEKGTTITIRIPIHEMEDIQAPFIEHQSLSPQNETFENTDNSPNADADKLILWVEDNDDMRNFVQSLLKNEGFEVITAVNGAEGIKKAFEYIPNLIISDVMMPEKDGYDLTDALKNDIRTSHIPIVLLTAKSSLDSRLAGLKIGADEYIGKPFNSEELLLRVHRLIEMCRRIQAKYSNEKPTMMELAIEKNDNKTENEVYLSELDIAFLHSLTTFIEKNIDNTALDVQDFTDALYMSRSQLHRKMIALTQQSITEFLRNFRLDKAYKLLSQNVYNVNEVADMTGFGNAKYFSTVYKKRYGVSPSEK